MEAAVSSLKDSYIPDDQTHHGCVIGELDDVARVVCCSMSQVSSVKSWGPCVQPLGPFVQPGGSMCSALGGPCAEGGVQSQLPRQMLRNNGVEPELKSMNSFLKLSFSRWVRLGEGWSRAICRAVCNLQLGHDMPHDEPLDDGCECDGPIVIEAGHLGSLVMYWRSEG